MYITKSILSGLKILGFDKETIKTTSREKSLEEIFLSTLFLNYLIVLVVYSLGLIIGGYRIQGREVNMPVLLGLLMVYPFAYNLIVYFVYGFFALMAEMVNKKNHVKPLIAVGFHTAIVYTIIIYVIGLLSTFNILYGGFLLAAFLLYFIYTMFLSISTIYEYSFGQTLMVIIIPFLLIGIILMLLMLFTDIPRVILQTILT